jgi:NADPH:quinone reductase-like Zn-dependent oxidoreductase
MWRRAEGILRVKLPVEQLATMNVLAFGGGVSELFLMLARHRGHNAFFCSGSPERRKALEEFGIIGIDQKQFNRFADRDDTKAFGKEVKRLTDGTGMHIVCDLLRGPVFDAGIAAHARMGVNVSAGWQLGTMVSYNSAGASAKQITFDHTHYETPTGIESATSLYGSVFKPTIHSEIYDFEDLPRAIVEMQANRQTGIPIIRVAKDMPQSVQHLIP